MARILPVLLGLVIAAAIVTPASAQTLTPDQWREDINAVHQAVLDQHPNPFHTLSRADFDARLDALSAELPRLSERDIVLRLAAIVAALGEGHSRLDLPMRQEPGGPLAHQHGEPARVAPFGRLPIRLEWTDMGFVVSEAAPDLAALLGSVVTAIGDTPVAEAASLMAPLVNADNAWQRRYLTGYFLTVPEALAWAGIDGAWQFQTRRRTIRRPLEARVLAVDSLHKLPMGPRPPAGDPEARLWVEARPGGIVYAHVGEILDQPALTLDAFAARIEAVLAGQERPILVYDLRANGGGDNTLIDPLVRLVVRDVRLWEPGRLFVLVDGWTFSAAQNFANALQRWTPALFVGSPTGASPNSYGDARAVRLPNSGLTARISTLYWQDAGPQDRRDTLRPHIPVPVIPPPFAGEDLAMNLVAGFNAPPAVEAGIFAGHATFGGRDTDVQLELGETSHIALPGIGVPQTPFEALEVRPDGTLAGRLAVGRLAAEFSGRITGDWLLGMVKVRGRYYPMALRAAAVSVASP